MCSTWHILGKSIIGGWFPVYQAWANDLQVLSTCDACFSFVLAHQLIIIIIIFKALVHVQLNGSRKH